MNRTVPRVVLGLLLAIGSWQPAVADTAGSATRGRIAARNPGSWQRVLFLQDYNTRVVVVGTGLLGLAAGTVGSFTLLRKRALLGDAISHATLPGLGAAFMITASAVREGKSLAALLAGAAATGLLGAACIVAIRRGTRIKEDAALGVVLSVFFGAGVAILGLVQQMDRGHAAGLEAFIYGKTASMIAADAWLIGAAGLTSAVVALLLFKELQLLCFDSDFAGSQGLPTVTLDGLLMVLVVLVTIIGLQAVGLILMIALLVIPAASARFWTRSTSSMALCAAGLGALSCGAGSAVSALAPKLPSGAMIVLTAAAGFGVSLVAGTQGGVCGRWLRRRRLQASIDRQHLLRGLYERAEVRSGGRVVEPLPAGRVPAGMPPAGTPDKVWPRADLVGWAELRQQRNWSGHRLRRAIRRAQRDELLQTYGDQGIRLTRRGQREAARRVREHRLWELYLIHHADVAPSQVDRDADAIEHVLGPEILAELEQLLEEAGAPAAVPLSPHPLPRAHPPSTASDLPE